MKISRRGFFSGLAALVAAPAIVRVESLMQVVPTEIIRPLPEGLVKINPTFLGSRSLLTIDQITREAVALFRNSNHFIQELDRQYAEDFAFSNGTQWGTELKIRLPKDFVVS